jgi:hypothetical protein
VQTPPRAGRALAVRTPLPAGGSTASRAERAAAGVDPVKGRCSGSGHGRHRAALGVDRGPWGETEEEDGVRRISAQVRVKAGLQAVVTSPGAPMAMAAAVGKLFSTTTRGCSHGR